VFVVVRSELNSANKFHGFLNSTANDLSANWKFCLFKYDFIAMRCEPI
jgi:hypothetical protein